MFALPMYTPNKHKHKMAGSQPASPAEHARTRNTPATARTKVEDGPPAKKTKIIFVEQPKKKLDFVSHTNLYASEGTC
jgi:hypothetical protein